MSNDGTAGIAYWTVPVPGCGAPGLLAGSV